PLIPDTTRHTHHKTSHRQRFPTCTADPSSKRGGHTMPSPRPYIDDLSHGRRTFPSRNQPIQLSYLPSRGLQRLTNLFSLLALWMTPYETTLMGGVRAISSFLTSGGDTFREPWVDLFTRQSKHLFSR
ncbi:unnamed protein product, partial [Ectocarpus fasciculatus]